ncbi:MAG: hypothetical protein QMD92_07040 [bacterium]|nr:hypothetical protein [bacterium]
MSENVSTFKKVLESHNYYHDPNNSIGLIRINDGAYFINLAFDNGLKELTSNIIYIKINRKVSKKFLACLVAGCGAGAFRCLFVGPGYLKCLGIYCGGAFIGCGLAWLLGLM